jgi:hypothetical protein
MDPAAWLLLDVPSEAAFITFSFLKRGVGVESNQRTSKITKRATSIRETCRVSHNQHESLAPTECECG